MSSGVICILRDGNRDRGSKANFAAWPQYALIMWSLKAAMCVYYLRLMVRSYCMRVPLLSRLCQSRQQTQAGG